MTKLTSLALVSALAVASQAPAQQATPDTTQVHVVRPGDTLWDLAARYLSNPFLWPEIFSLNRSTVGDPDLIYPLDSLLIPGRGAPVGAAGRNALNPATSRTIFFSAEPAAVGTTLSFQATPADELPLFPAGVFFAAAMLLPDREIAPVGRLREIISPTVVERRSEPQVQPYDRVNMVVLADVAVGDRLHLIRPDRLVEPYGRIFMPTGSARVLSIASAVATVEVDVFYHEVRIGDLALAMPEFVAAVNVDPVPASGIEGTLLAFEEAQPIPATEDRGFVDLGAASGVVEGDEFLVFLPASDAEWGRRPEVSVARLQVIRVERLTATVRVLSLEHPALAAGLPVRLVARMP